MIDRKLYNRMFLNFKNPQVPSYVHMCQISSYITLSVMHRQAEADPETGEEHQPAGDQGGRRHVL